MKIDRRVRPSLWVTLLLTALLAVLVTPTAARADVCAVSGCTGDVSGYNNPTSTGSGSGSGGAGTGCTAGCVIGAYSEGAIWFASGTGIPDPSLYGSWGPSSDPNGKPGVLANGLAYLPGTTPWNACASSAYLGVYWTYHLYTLAGSSESIVAVTYQCIYPPTFVYVTAFCPTQIRGTGAGPFGNPDPHAVTVTKSFTINTRYSVTGAPADCHPLAFAFPYTNPLWGQYKVAAQADADTLVIKHYTTPNARTGVTPPDEIVSRVHQTDVVNSKWFWQQTCRGLYSDGPTYWIQRGFTFTTADCPSVPPCTTATTPTVDGHPAPAEVYADGAKHSLRWTPSRPLAAATPTSTRFTLDPHSSPWRGNDTGTATTGPNDATQFFATSPRLDTAIDGQQRTLASRWFKPALLGRHWAVSPTWSYTGRWTSTYPTAITLSGTGTASASTAAGPVWGTTACTGRPATITALGSRLQAN